MSRSDILAQQCHHLFTHVCLVCHFQRSRRRFEEWLKSLDPSYGVRNLEDVIEAARSEGLVLVETIDMPANNLSVVFEKQKQ